MNAPDSTKQPQFVTEGFFVALPPGFAGVSDLPKLDESNLQHLAGPAPNGAVFAAAAGRDPLIFQFMPAAPYGYAVAWREEAESILGIDLLEIDQATYIVLLIHSGAALQLVLRRSVPQSEGIQEWGIHIPTYRRAQAVGHGPNGSLAVDAGRRRVFVADGSDLRCFEVEVEAGFREIGEPQPCGPGRLFVLPCGSPIVVNPEQGTVAVWRPDGGFSIAAQPGLLGATALTISQGRLLWADPAGALFSWQPSLDGPTKHGTVGLSPVSAIAELPDGRIYAFAGSGIAHWFRMEPGGRSAEDLGVAVSVLTSRRYGFEFSAIVVGNGGEMYCAESDRGGHLWVYFPPQHRCPRHG